MPNPTSFYKNMEDYKEAVEGKRRAHGPVFFGSLRTLVHYRDDIKQNNGQSKFYGRVLYPESPHRSDENGWSYDKNKAFWAGIIDTQQSLILVTDIKFYNRLTGTVDELLWLEDNGYTFTPHPRNPNMTLATPPPAPRENAYIMDYKNGRGEDCDNMHHLIARFKNIKKLILGKRPQPYARRQQPYARRQQPYARRQQQKRPPWRRSPTENSSTSPSPETFSSWRKKQPEKSTPPSRADTAKSWRKKSKPLSESPENVRKAPLTKFYTSKTPEKGENTRKRENRKNKPEGKGQNGKSPSKPTK